MQYKGLMLRNFLANININIILAKSGKVPNRWKMMEYIPGYNKLYYIKEGEGWIKVNGKEYFPKKNQLVLLPEGVLQSFSNIGDDVYKKYWCHFNAKVGNYNLFDIVKIPAVITVSDIDRLDSLFIDLINYENDSNVISYIMAKARLMEIICYLFSFADLNDCNKLINTTTLKKLDIVVEYIEKNISENLTIEELSDLINVHPNYFITLFKSNLGMSPIKYINNRKIIQAKNYLVTTDMSISQIADILGFKTVYYFSNVFKKTIGFSPSEYRKQY